MIKYNLNTINDWFFSTDNIIKVYRNNAICYYKIDSSSPSGQTPCYAVVEDISEYSDTEFEDVFNKADEKWYKLNNLNQYEEYGVYGSGRTITTYEGKLTIDTESTPQPSRLPQGYTEVEYVQNNTQGAYINTGLLLYDVTGNSFSISAKLKSQYESTWVGDGYYLQTIINSEDVSSPYYGFTFRYAYQTHILECTSSPSNSVTFSSTANTDGTSSLTINCNSTTVTAQVPLELFASYNRNYNTPYRFSNTTIYSFQVTKNNTLVRDLVPCKRDSDSMVGLYDIVNDVFYYPPNYTSYQLVAGSAVTPPSTTATCEFMYSGGSWVNVGEVSGGTIDTVWLDPNNTGSLNPSYQIGHYWGEGYKMIYTLYINGSYSTDTGSFWRWNQQTPIEFNFYSNGFYYDFHNPTSTTSPSVYTGDSSWRIMKNGTLINYESGQVMLITLTNGTVNVELESTGALITSASTTVTAQNWYNGLYQAYIGAWIDGNKVHIKEIQVYDANDVLVNDLKFVKNNTTGSQEISMYDSVLNVTYNNTNSNTPTYHVVEESGGTTYPIYYDEMQDPPNNLVFSSMAEAEAYECPWVGMKATIDGDRYIYSGDSQSGYEWVEDTNHYLPDIPYSFNYNAKQYIASTYTIPQTEGQLQNVDAVCNYGYKIVDHSADSYISVTGNSRMILSGNNGTYLNRSNTQANCPMTIISKAKTTSGYSIFTDRNSSSRQYMYRQDKTYAYLCGTGNTSLDSCICSDSIPSILSVRVYYDSGIKAKWNNWTTSASSTPEEYAYNNQSLTNGGALFCDYSNSNSEFWQGDFYWIYMSQTELTDEQIQQVIDYNENL